MKLKNKITWVTGSSGGIGEAVVWALANEGADMAISYLNEGAEESARMNSLAEKIKKLGRRVLLVPGDVTDQASVENDVKKISEHFGRLDIFVSCAAYSDREVFTSANMAGFRKTIDVTMWGAFYALRAASNQMIKQSDGGSCVIISSPLALLPAPGCMAYNMAKAAIDQMSRTAATELAHLGVRVNTIHAGLTDTAGERKFHSTDVLKKMGELSPIGRLVTPEEIARGVLFLVDSDSGALTGTTLAIDGGIHLPRFYGHKNS